MHDTLEEIRELVLTLQCESSAKDPQQFAYSRILELVDLEV